MVIGMSLRHLCGSEGIDRNSLFISSKVGYVFEELPKGVNSNDVINSHCVHPTFLKAQLEMSLKNIGL